jgi:hypothetical protein
MLPYVKVNSFFANLDSETVKSYRKILLIQELNKRIWRYTNSIRKILTKYVVTLQLNEEEYDSFWEEFLVFRGQLHLQHTNLIWKKEIIEDKMFNDIKVRIEQEKEEKKKWVDRPIREYYWDGYSMIESKRVVPIKN